MHRLILHGALLIGLLFCHCARQPDDPSRLTLSVQVKALYGRSLGKSAIEPGATLRTGDQLQLDLQVNHPAFVYLVLNSSVTGAKRHPTGYEDRPRAPGAPQLSFPFQLSPPAGEEEILILASQRPLAGDICAQWNLSCPAESQPEAASRGDVRPTPPKPPKPPRPPPPPPPPTTRTAAERDGAFQEVRSGHVVFVRGDRLGVARLRFDFHHLP